ncbi:MAG: hypothetical protein IPO88_07085 [Nannocystis sp.]|uniref:hypothetical protein n=1 Tax=Nannocystis sp. TaxID=1962667 RepID=UPI0024251C64|nr:hypothetical protein [Nannocystis sp.]MBK9753261.1 hypothetical protein [Nannocystis sp.]
MAGAGLVAALLFAGVVEAREPRGSAVGEPRAAVQELASPCREQVAAELRRGEVDAGVQCEVERRLALRRQLRGGRSLVGFGLVERATAGLAGLSLLLSEARGCARWPLRLPGREALGLFEAKAAGCWIRRYTGPLTVAGVLPDGGRVVALVVEVVEGHLELDLARIAVSLDRRGLPDLDAFVRLELGADGWAGSLDLVVQRARLADWHVASVQRGRGVAALCSVRHPEHRQADVVRTLALTASLRRQEADLRAVQRGELTPRRFLERHAWSPYRQLVAAMGAPWE